VSDLRARLSALRGAQPAASPATGEGSLRERLRELGRARGERTAPPHPGDADLAQALDGRVVAPGLLLVERRVPYGTLHGRYPLQPGTGSSVFLDTETTGLAGGTGTTVFLIGLATADEDALRVRQLLLTLFAGEPALLATAAELVRSGETLVTYNGRSFDGPLLAARYRLAGLPDPFCRLGHVDLLHPTRRAFGRVWPDCRLQTAERCLLGFARTDDLPGADAPEVWLDWVRRGHIGRMPALLRHNLWDLLSLAALVPALDRACDAPTRHGADAGAVARHRARNGDGDHAYRLLLTGRDRLDRAGLLDLARLARRREAWDVALAVWEDLASRDDLQALECLAKYREHRLRDPAAALELVRRLLVLDPGNAEHQRRHRRLQRALAGSDRVPVRPASPQSP
jgi:hypothetical protein